MHDTCLSSSRDCIGDIHLYAHEPLGLDHVYTRVWPVSAERGPQGERYMTFVGKVVAPAGPVAQAGQGSGGMQGKIWLEHGPGLQATHQLPLVLHNVRVSVHMGSCHTFAMMCWKRHEASLVFTMT